MPIIDPISFCSLLNEVGGTKSKYSKNFFIRYLKIASKNLYRSSQTIDISFQFKEDLKASFYLLNKIFGCNFAHKSDFDNPMTNDYYRFLYNNIDSKYKDKILKIQKGSYRFLYNNFKIYFFKPIIDISNSRSWFLTTSPIAILVIKEDEFFSKSIIQLSNLEIDLMLACGFTVILCLKMFLKNNNYKEILNDMIRSHHFAEIHFNIDISEKDEIEKIEDFYLSLLKIYDKIDGYFYLYSQFVLNKECKTREIIKILKHRPRFRYIFTSTNINGTLKSFKSVKTKPFPYCKTGFDDDYLFVSLCNVPLYRTENDDNDFLITEYSGVSIGYISKEDFLNYKESRIKIIFNDPKNGNIYVKRYIDFNDIHLIRSDMYVNDTIYLAKTEKKSLDIINGIRSKIDQFKKLKKSVFSRLKKMDFKDYLFYASRELEKFYSGFIDKFKIHDNQLLTVLDACQSCFFSKEKKNTGVIYQVETGEGKSCIVQIIAAILALKKKTVHIASSNISLSNRDYYDSFDFFKQLGLKSAVLLHYNELPFVDNCNKMNSDTIYDLKKYPSAFFKKHLFNNPSRMNFSICGIDINNTVTTNKADIIFSTIPNLECLYLKMQEMCPAFIPKYFGKCSLLIDEADSILIDELTNGTIISRPIKTNADEILKYVYESRINNVSINDVYEHIHNTWPECIDLMPGDVELMFQEIDLVQQEEFVDGKKYSITEIKKEEKISISNMKKMLKKAKEQSIQFIKNIVKMKEDQTKKSDKHKKEDNKSMKNSVKMIIPFDYKHKGILEPNKEFGGFVQQFIAIKEMYQNEKNSNMKIKDVTMNYLFVSHPIFINLYDAVVGLTGTIGNKYDKEILKDQYNLTTMKIPRNNPNRRVELPILLCKNIEDRNRKIVSEIIHFHEKGNPVLVIFQDLNEISLVLYLLKSKGIMNIFIYDGKDVDIKPDNVSGLKGSITLGTNVCGRGTDIKNPKKPLHVIVTYYTSNSRVMFQAFGRTARQGNEGSVRVICVKEQFFLSIDSFNSNDVDDLIDDFKFKNKLQFEFTERYKKFRPWLFTGNIDSQILSENDISTLRETKINVNRVKACNFQFPICMSVETFLNIQSQKIFSLYNCPNCKYTWRLFQQYLRELLLQSWSLLIAESERKFNKERSNISYQKYLREQVDKLYYLLDTYLPNYDNEINNNIVETFMNIYKKVANKYEQNVMDIFPDRLTKLYKQFDMRRFCSFSIGFKPYSLFGNKSNTIGEEEQENKYIFDPELTYLRKMPKKRFMIVSITEKVDDVFNKICKKINDIIGSYIGLKFFMRRTLGGCEFGICVDYDIKVPDILKKYDCLIDQDPLLIFTISIKSMTPFLAGILIFGLFYTLNIAKTIAELFSGFPLNGIVKLVLAEIISKIASSQIEKICNSVCSLLVKSLMKSIDILDQYNTNVADIFKILLKTLIPRDFSISGDAIQKLFEEKINLTVNSDFGSHFIQNGIPWAPFIKIGLLIMLCFASFLMGFHYKKALSADESKIAKEYDKTQDIEKVLNENEAVFNNYLAVENE